MKQEVKTPSEENQEKQRPETEVQNKWTIGYDTALFLEAKRKANELYSSMYDAVENRMGGLCVDKEMKAFGALHSNLVDEIDKYIIDTITENMFDLDTPGTTI